MTIVTASAAPITIGRVTDTTGVWGDTVRQTSHATLAHSPEWFTAIKRAYGHEPMYLAGEDEDGSRGVLPAFIVRRPFFGTVVTSMPFLDGGGPSATSQALDLRLAEGLVSEARRIGASSVEMRCTRRLPVPDQPLEHKVNLALALPSDPDVLWRTFDKSVRNQIRKAEKAGVSIDFGGATNLDAFYDAFAARMRDLGSPVHAPGFLRAVVGMFGTRARVVLARKGDVTVGGLIALAFKTTLVVPWAASLKEHFALCPNMLLYWETIRTACLDGFDRFEFGRSTRDSGTYRFKRQWGAVEEPLFWYTIPTSRSVGGVLLDPATGDSDPAARAALLSKMWQRLPLSLTRQLGPRIRRYLIQ
jgi:serine/alanine adding enzyme